MENAINMGWELFIEGGSSKKEKEGKKRRGKKRKKREEKKREKEREGNEREKKRKGKRCSDGRNSSDQEVKSVYSTKSELQEVGILPILVSFYLLSYCFSLLSRPHCAIFMACFVVLIRIWPILRSQFR